MNSRSGNKERFVISTLAVNLFLIILLSSYHCYAFDDGDFQYWNTESIEVTLDKDWKIKVAEEFRFGDNAGAFYYNHTDAGISYLLNEYFGLTVNYRQIFQKKNNKWNPEYRPHINGTVKAKRNDLVFKDRNRLEYRIIEGDGNSWRYRNKLSVDLPFKWTKLNIQPYIADEIFYNFDENRLSRNRVCAGFKMHFLKNLKGEIYYMYQSTKSSEWNGYNILGTRLKLVF